MKYLSLIICATALLLAGCKKKDKFKLEVESASFGVQTEVFNSGSSLVKLRLRDAAEGFGETVKITVENLPSQIKAITRPDSSVVVTDAGVDIYVDFNAKDVPLDATYPVTFRFSWEGGSLTRDAVLRIVPYNAAKALAGIYTGSSNCDSLGSSFPTYTTEVLLDTGINRIKIRNFANMGDDVYVVATLDSSRKRVYIPMQYFGTKRIGGEGTYSQTSMNINCIVQYSTISKNCNVSMGILQE
jgi:hypothetical protein